MFQLNPYSHSEKIKTGYQELPQIEVRATKSHFSSERVSPCLTVPIVKYMYVMSRSASTYIISPGMFCLLYLLTGIIDAQSTISFIPITSPHPCRFHRTHQQDEGQVTIGNHLLLNSCLLHLHRSEIYHWMYPRITLMIQEFHRPEWSPEFHTMKNKLIRKWWQPEVLIFEK